ncbi:MAG TPA: hypothetical protein VMC07_02675 [Candidatus Omnitrophota bacterium]|nr:hypothetical protein [Candidatus Omnitrophota bacterium]
MGFALISVPDWFLTPDFLINVFSFLVLSVFLILCIKNFRLNKNKKMLYLGIGFAFIALAQLAVLARKFGLYYNTSFTTSVGATIIQYNVMNPTDILYRLGTFLYKSLSLIGLYIISRFPKKKTNLKDVFLIAYFIVLSVLSSDVVGYLFRITSMGMFAYLSYNYYLLYKKNKFRNTFILSGAFAIMSLAQILFMVSVFVAGIVADLLQLGSYIILLILIIRILKHGNEKEPDGHNIGHVKHSPRKRRKH